MDGEMIAFWSRVADYHERQAEKWLGFAQRRRSNLDRYRAMTVDHSNSGASLVIEYVKRSVESNADQCHRMAVEHRRMACYYRAFLETPWQTSASRGTGDISHPTSAVDHIEMCEYKNIHYHQNRCPEH